MPVVLSGMSGRPRGGAFLGPGPEPVPGWRSDGDGSAAVPGILPSRLQHHIHTAMCLRFHHILIPSSRAGLISEKPLRAGSWLRSAPVRRRESCCQEGGVLVEQEGPSGQDGGACGAGQCAECDCGGRNLTPSRCGMADDCPRLALWGLALRASVPGSANDRSRRWRGRWVNYHGPEDLFSECRSGPSARWFVFL